ncbi:hypothetical protein HYG87_08190 [Methanobacterium alkalithermotolerans]|uniref:Uncharacterized protein n=1 Tax=Methanobacterium alkalithermotolerans TaxID=2731220 RepID=A0A8T8K6S8_9EURY|nr:hypothetical protein [Methanobacterium alkalithermotolerans]MBU4535968.1 hypothetical protein [Euryarchaeota archaeon]MBV1730341.1 hypothetical protein [Methanobacterium sp.]MBU4607983.1 hypothetical protein [Euryarchaeota archaeon]MBV1754907.1 hypothetical protein [Methanobacterium sp.]MBV1767598.1 hypothetical protein [Methanobacterium sp.]
MLHEMRIPPGVTGLIMAEVMENYKVEMVHTDYGPMLQGEVKELEKVRDFLVKALNERINELENKK